MLSSLFLTRTRIQNRLVSAHSSIYFSQFSCSSYPPTLSLPLNKNDDVAAATTRRTIINTGASTLLSSSWSLWSSATSNSDNCFNNDIRNVDANSHQIRCVHSKRQIKRLFKNNFARKRVEERLGVDRTPKPLDPPKYDQIIKEPVVLQNGWSPLPSSDVEIPDYPFRIKRTSNKPNDAIGFLPVYSNYSNGGTKTTTRIKHVLGDRDAFIKELRSVFNWPPPKNGNPNDDVIRIRTGGTIEVKGLHVRRIKTWLTGLGF